MPGGNIIRITPDDVRELLDSLVSPSVEFDHTNVLLSLSLVDDYISHLDMLNLSYPRAYALQNLVIDAITDELRYHRLFFEHPFERQETRREAVENLKNDYKLDAIEIMAWSVLYYCYVRVDLNFSLKSMSKLLHLTQRTLRRYRQHGVQRLYEVILDHERISRLKARERRLYAQLPGLPHKQIIGRDSVFSQLQHFYDAHQHGTILVSGMPGIGKTAFLRWFIGRQIERNEWIDHVLWVKNPDGLQDIKTAIQQMDNLDENSFQAFCLQFNVIVIIDDAEHVIDALPTVSNWFKNCFVMMSANRQHISPDVDLHLTLRELDESQIKKFINHVYANASVREDLISSAYLKSIMTVTGGNPTAILLVAQQYALGNFETLQVVNTFDALVEKIYDSVSEQSQFLWVVSAICDVEIVSLDDMRNVWHISMDAIDELIKCHILICLSLSPVKHCYASIAGHFARKRYSDGNIATRKIVNTILSQLDRQIALHAVPLRIVNEVLKAEWLDISFERQRLWARQLSKMNEKPLELWHQILRRTYDDVLDPQDMRLNLEYCRMLRQSGKWKNAEKGLNYILEHTGLQADFDTQVLAMIEYSILFKQRGNFEHALKLLQRANFIAEQRNWTHLIQCVRLEQAQIAAERLDGQDTLRHLETIPTSLRSVMLAAEAHLILSDYDRAYTLCYQGLEIAGNQRSALANLHDLLGRIDMASKSYEEAMRHFSTADSYFNASGDLFKQARCWSNLGVAIMRMGDVVQARHYLTKAQRVQQALGDSLGSRLTTHNLSLIARHY